MHPLSAADARRDTWPKDVWLPNPSKGRATWETGGPRTPEGLTKAMSRDTSLPSVNGQTLEGITGEVNLYCMEQPESTTVLPVTAIATVRIQQEVIGGLSQQDLWEAQLADPNLTEILKAKEAGTDPTPPWTPQGEAMESKSWSYMLVPWEDI